jgi:hypothetical protein
VSTRVEVEARGVGGREREGTTLSLEVAERESEEAEVTYESQFETVTPFSTLVTPKKIT